MSRAARRDRRAPRAPPPRRRTRRRAAVPGAPGPRAPPSRTRASAASEAEAGRSAPSSATRSRHGGAEGGATPLRLASPARSGRPHPPRRGDRVDKIGRERAQVKKKLIERRKGAQPALAQTRQVGPVHLVDVERAVIRPPAQRDARRFVERL